MKLKCYVLSISEICRLYRNGSLVLDPPYQRRPAWGTKQRRDLLSSVFNGIPLPAVILFKTKSGYRTWHYEVMDGKQRLETLLHFRYGRVIRGEKVLDFLLWTEDPQRRTRLRYRDLRKEETRKTLGVSVRKFLDYKVPVIEYSGALEGMGGRNIAQWEIFKYKLIFAGPAKALPQPMPFADATTGSMQGPRYTSLAKLLAAKRVSDLFT